MSYLYMIESGCCQWAGLQKGDRCLSPDLSSHHVERRKDRQGCGQNNQEDHHKGFPMGEEAQKEERQDDVEGGKGKKRKRRRRKQGRKKIASVIVFSWDLTRSGRINTRQARPT